MEKGIAVYRVISVRSESLPLQQSWQKKRVSCAQKHEAAGDGKSQSRGEGVAGIEANE